MGLAASRAWLGILLLAAAPASAQHGFIPPDDRPVHGRLAAARIVALGTVTHVGEARIQIDGAEAVLGMVPSSFEVKRAPSRPPPWVEGDRVLLLLAGARSPYRWVDAPAEAPPALDGAEAERRWVGAIRAMDAARTDATARRDLYARWCDEGPEDLRSAGLRGLLDVPGMVGALDAPFARERAAVAADAERPLEVRRAAARVATRHPAGIEALLAHLAEAGPGSHPEIADISLQAALRTRSPAAEARLVDLLPEATGALREVVLRLAAYALGPDVERELAEMVVGHPDAAVRTEAAASLERLRRNRRSRGG